MICPTCHEDTDHWLHDEYHRVFEWNAGVFADAAAREVAEHAKREQLREHRRLKDEKKNRPQGGGLL